MNDKTVNLIRMREARKKYPFYSRKETNGSDGRSTNSLTKSKTAQNRWTYAKARLRLLSTTADSIDRESVLSVSTAWPL